MLTCQGQNTLRMNGEVMAELDAKIVQPGTTGDRFLRQLYGELTSAQR